jgi:hypothetical protein
LPPSRTIGIFLVCKHIRICWIFLLVF